MVDTPKRSGNGDEAKIKESGSAPVTDALSGTDPRANAKEQTQNSDQERSYSQYIVWPFVAVWKFLFKPIWKFFLKPIGQFLDRHNTSVTAIATIVIGFLTYNYVKYSKEQWEVMNGQLEEMKKTRQDNRELVDLQKQIAKATFGAFVDLNREWMGVKHSEQSKKVWVAIQVENYGVTAADSVLVAASLAFRDSTPSKSERGNFTIADGKPIELSTLPAIKTSQNIPDSQKIGNVPQAAVNQVSPGEYPRLKDERMRIYVWGKIYYKDLAGDSRPTDFCQYAPAKNALEALVTDYPNGPSGYPGPYKQCE